MVEVGDCMIKVTFILISKSTIVIGLGKFWIQKDGLVEVGYCPIIITFLTIGYPPHNVGLR